MPSRISWSGHLLVLSHLIVCVAVIPWPRERVLKSSGFEVIMPNERRQGD